MVTFWEMAANSAYDMLYLFKYLIRVEVLVLDHCLHLYFHPEFEEHSPA